jgi:hypothetical protein
MLYEELSRKHSEGFGFSFPDDDPHAMLVLLRVLHLDNLNVPRDLTFPELVNLAKVCVKYKAYTPLIPWLQMWLPRHVGMALHLGFEDWLLVSWVFREPEVFKSLSRAFIYEGVPSIHGWVFPVSNVTLHDIRSGNVIFGLSPPPRRVR